MCSKSSFLTFIFMFSCNCVEADLSTLCFNAAARIARLTAFLPKDLLFSAAVLFYRMQGAFAFPVQSFFLIKCACAVLKLRKKKRRNYTCLLYSSVAETQYIFPPVWNPFLRTKLQIRYEQRTARRYEASRRTSTTINGVPSWQSERQPVSRFFFLLF